MIWTDCAGWRIEQADDALVDLAQGQSTSRARDIPTQCSELAEDLATTRQRIDDLLASDLEALRVEVATAGSAGWNLVEEIAEELDDEIAELQATLDELRRAA